MQKNLNAKKLKYKKIEMQINWNANNLIQYLNSSCQFHFQQKYQLQSTIGF